MRNQLSGERHLRELKYKANKPVFCRIAARNESIKELILYASVAGFVVAFLVHYINPWIN